MVKKIIFSFVPSVPLWLKIRIDLMTNRLAGVLSNNNEHYKHAKPDFYKTILSEKGPRLDVFIQDLKDGLSQR